MSVRFSTVRTNADTYTHTHLRLFLRETLFVIDIVSRLMIKHSGENICCYVALNFLFRRSVTVCSQCFLRGYTGTLSFKLVEQHSERAFNSYASGESSFFSKLIIHLILPGLDLHFRNILLMIVEPRCTNLS